MNELLIAFLKTQTCATICVIDDLRLPYCFSCYYIFDMETALLYYKSSLESYHSLLIEKNPNVAGTILPDKLNKIKVKGVQFTGMVIDKTDQWKNGAFKKYHDKFPMALVRQGSIYTVQLHSIKMTDSSKLFGKKMIWVRK